MATVIVTEPTAEPLDLAEVKEHLRIYGDTDHDSELLSLITEARHYVENVTGKALVTQTWDYKIDYFTHCIRVPKPPLQSITSISYQDSVNSTQVLSSTYYVVDSTLSPARITPATNKSYPATYGDSNSVTVRFVAGYGTVDEVPEKFKRAMKLYIQWQFDGDNSMLDALESILSQDRIAIL